MATIQFDTVVDEGRTESGELDNHVLVTESESRPNFILGSDGSVTLYSAKADVEVPGFGCNAEIVDGDSL